MSYPLISPNLHVVLIHYPLAMLIAGTFIELFSFLWSRSTFRLAGRWMILLGALSAIPATFSGIYALRDISRIDVDTDMRWVDLKNASPVFSHPEIWEMLRRHMLYQSINTAVAALVVVVWLGASDRMRSVLRLPLLVVLLIPVIGMISGAWLGGESVYRKGVGVEPVFPVATARETKPSTQPITWMNTPTRVERMFPPIEQHAIMAGAFTAIALVSIGLSFRKISSVSGSAHDELILPGDPATALSPAVGKATTTDMVRSFNPNVEFAIHPMVPAGRFWMLTFLIGLLSLTGGLFVLARASDVFTQMNGNPRQLPQLLWNQVKPAPGEKINRLLVHGATGSAIVVLPIVLALLTRFAPRERIMLSITTLVLLLAVAVQVWMGVLLLFDTSDGPITRFNPPAMADK